MDGVHADHWVRCEVCGHLGRSLQDEPRQKFVARLIRHGWTLTGRWTCPTCSKGGA